MADNKALGGLGDFNIPQPSQSNTTAQDGDQLSQLLNNQVMDELGKARQIGQQMDQLRSGQGDKSFLQRLLSPEGLIPLLLAGGAAAAGQPGVAAGIGIGGLQGITGAEEADRSQRKPGRAVDHCRHPPRRSRTQTRPKQPTGLSCSSW